MKLNNEKVLKELERTLETNLTPELLHYFRYSVASDYQISRRDVSKINAGLDEFISSFRDPSIMYFSVSSKNDKNSLHEKCIYLRINHTKKKAYLKVYNPAGLIIRNSDYTIQIDDLGLLRQFEDELYFIQSGKILAFNELKTSEDVVAISKTGISKNVDDNKFVFHYCSF